VHPQHGGRFLLERVAGEHGDGEIRYRASLFTPEQRFDAAVAVRIEDGDVAFSAFEPGAPPPWLVTATRAFLRAEWKARKAPGGAPWPERITRWREEKSA
jgi:hypothetical protein